MVIAVAKTKMINVRISEQTHNEFKIACDLKGAGMAQILHQYIVRTIREEKQREPQAFEKSDLIAVPHKGILDDDSIVEKKKAS